MSKFYTHIMRSAMLLSLVWFASCQPDAALPNTLIPPGCRLGLAHYIYESYTGDSTTYLYDTFGHLTQMSTTRRDKGRITRQLSTTYAYTQDHYLAIRTNRAAAYVNGSLTASQGAYSYEYQGEPKQIQKVQFVGQDGASDSPQETTYQYNGTQLSQFKEVAKSGAVTNQITFTTDGKPSQIQKASFQIINLTNGLISRTISGKDTALYTYDGQGQPTSIITSSGATGERTERTFTYDGRRPTRTGELKLRGFPDTDLSGYGQPQSNLLTETTRQFRSGFLTATTALRYNYAYNDQGYATGYSRSDGVRARFYYTNCP